MKSLFLESASSTFNLLNGVCCVFKSAGETVGNVRRAFLYKLSTELCEMKSKEPTQFVEIEGDTTKPMNVRVFPSYVDNPLVMGPKYQPDDFKCMCTNQLGVNTSGILVLGLNVGTKTGMWLREINPIRTYRVSGRLGEAKHNLFSDGKTLDKGGFKHVKQSSIEHFMATLQSAHQRKMFDLCGVDITSQTAYEMASEGLIRPANRKVPLIYSIKCISYKSPDFVLEIHCVNEYEDYLKAIIYDTGIKLRTVAHCTKIQCIKHSFFTLEHALLKKHWTLQDVIKNLSICKKLIEDNGNITQKLAPVNNSNKQLNVT